MSPTINNIPPFGLVSATQAWVINGPAGAIGNINRLVFGFGRRLSGKASHILGLYVRGLGRL